MREDEIYLLTKKWVVEQDYQILGGQPPNGTDRFPVIEIKSGENNSRGSRTSFKPDLVIATSEFLTIIECKPKFDYADILKLQEISSSRFRLQSLISEIRQRRSLERRDHELALLTDLELTQRTRFCVSYAGQPQPVEGIYSLVFDISGTKSILYFGNLLLQEINR